MVHIRSNPNLMKLIIRYFMMVLYQAIYMRLQILEQLHHLYSLGCQADILYLKKHPPQTADSKGDNHIPRFVFAEEYEKTDK